MATPALDSEEKFSKVRSVRLRILKSAERSDLLAKIVKNRLKRFMGDCQMGRQPQRFEQPRRHHVSALVPARVGAVVVLEDGVKVWSKIGIAHLRVDCQQIKSIIHADRDAILIKGN